MKISVLNIIRGIELNFANLSLPDAEMIRHAVLVKTPETEKECQKRKKRQSGIRVLEPTPLCSVAGLVENIRSSAYQMVSASIRRGFDPKGKRQFYRLSFFFVLKEYATPSPAFERIAGPARLQLEAMCKSSVFNEACAFENPFYRQVQEVEGVRTLSFNLTGRQRRANGAKEKNLLEIMGDAAVVLPIVKTAPQKAADKKVTTR